MQTTKPPERIIFLSGRSVNLSHIVNIEFLNRPYCARIVETAFARQFVKLGIGRIYSKLTERNRHIPRRKSVFERRYRFQGGGSRIGFANAEHIFSKARKFFCCFGHNITRPCAPNRRQPRSVGYAKHSAEFVFQLVRSPISNKPIASDAIVRKRGCPHYLGSRRIIFGL